MSRCVKKSKEKVENLPIIIKNLVPPMTESEKMRVKREIEQKLYEIFRKYY